MRRFSIPIALVGVLAISGTALAAPPLQTFGPGDVTVTSRTSATIVNDADEYGGVYINARSLGNKLVGDVMVSYVSTGDVTGGAPRINLPIDTNGDKKMDIYATLDAANCGGVSGETTVVSTENPNCYVYFLGSGEAFPNWDAFVAAHPTYRIASKGDGSIPFIIADIGPGTYMIEQIDIQ